MSNPATYKVECPHPQCQANLGIRYNLPAGDYQCHCHSCMVRLSWDNYLSGDLVPRLTLVSPKDAKVQP